jgi:nucleotide-binding universal stress UspA family protein
MAMLEGILVAVDFSDASGAALGYAAELARRIGTSLTALYVSAARSSYEPFPTFQKQAPTGPAETRQLAEKVRDFVSSAGGPPEARVAVGEGDTADEIVAEAARLGAGLIVVGTHGQRGFERWTLGSVTDRLVRQADRPVLAVPANAARSAPARLLCALDLSDGSVEVLDYAVALAEALQARVVLLHVAEGRHWYEPWPISGVDTDAMRQAVDDFARRRLSELAAGHVPQGVTSELQVTFGRPEREIERLAAEADLVVLGVPSRHGIDRFFFGSTAQHVLRAGTAPVLLVRHPAAAPPSSEVEKQVLAP